MKILLKYVINPGKSQKILVVGVDKVLFPGNIKQFGDFIFCNTQTLTWSDMWELWINSLWNLFWGLINLNFYKKV